MTENDSYSKRLKKKFLKYAKIKIHNQNNNNNQAYNHCYGHYKIFHFSNIILINFFILRFLLHTSALKLPE